MEAQRKILLAVQNVQEKVASPRGAAGGSGGYSTATAHRLLSASPLLCVALLPVDTVCVGVCRSPLDLLLSAVTVTVPGTSPNLRK
jgi:hypothetical protein